MPFVFIKLFYKEEFVIKTCLKSLILYYKEQILFHILLMFVKSYHIKKKERIFNQEVSYFNI